MPLTALRSANYLMLSDVVSQLTCYGSRTTGQGVNPTSAGNAQRISVQRMPQTPATRAYVGRTISTLAVREVRIKKEAQESPKLLAAAELRCAQ